MSSCSSASPYGPLFAEFTAYESSKYGVGCWNGRDQAGEIGSAPRPIELEPGLPRRAREPRGPLLGRLGARVGREPERWIEGEVPLLVHGGIATAGVGVVPAR